MTAASAMRVNYFDRQFLRLAEFQDEQAYHIALRRRHNLSHHSWGIVAGLAIVKEADVLVVLPGLAVDGYGRELMLADRITIDRAVFDRYGTNRLDVWLEYELSSADASAPADACDPRSAGHQYRALETAQVMFERAAAADVDARSPQAVPADVIAASLPDTPDDPRQRWPVYLGRVSMKFDASGKPDLSPAPTALAYIGLNAELIDHPANASRIELGHDPRAGSTADQRNIAGTTYTYEGDADRRFAVFVPGTDPAKTTLAPTISVTPQSTKILGTAEIHGDLVLDGTTLVFPKNVPEERVNAGDGPAIYWTSDDGDALRIDLGDTKLAARTLAIGVTKDGKFRPVLEIVMPTDNTAPQVTITGDLHVTGAFTGPDIRLRTLSQDLIPQLAAMLQVGVLTGTA